MEKLIKFWTLSDKFFLIPIMLSVLIILIITVLYLATFSKLPPRLPLFYSLPWGEAQLAQKDQFIVLPAIIILVTLTHTFITYHLHPSQVVLKRILMVSLIPINLTIMITVVKIILIFL